MKELGLLVQHTPAWFSGLGEDSDIVISSRIRLARNLQGYVYTHKLTDADQNTIISKTGHAISQSSALKEAYVFNYERLSDMERMFLVERHLISKEHASEQGKKAVSISSDESLSIMVLEEDHLRIQSFKSGFDLKGAWEVINRLDDELERELDYAFSDKLGYLTACPTNVGTGMRASCMLHIPALILTKQIQKVLQALTKLNLATRGLYGEGTQAVGEYFQFSNQMTLGQTEDEIVGNMVSVIRQVVDHEREARTYLHEKKKSKFEDQIWRALGVLKTARVISSSEATQLLSLLQLGMNMGLIKCDFSREDMNLLFGVIQPAHLQMLAGNTLSASERDFKRAQIVRDRLGKVFI